MRPSMLRHIQVRTTIKKWHQAAFRNEVEKLVLLHYVNTFLCVSVSNGSQ